MVLAQLIKREIKAFLKNPAFAVSIILVVVLYGSIGGIARRGVEEAVRVVATLNIGVVLEEDTSLIREVVRILNETTGGRVALYNNLRDAVEESGVGIVLRKGFTENATNPYAPIVLDGLVKVDTTSQMRVQAKVGVVSQLIGLVKFAVVQAVKNVYGEELYRDKPIYPFTRALFYEREVDPDLLQGFITFISFLPLLVAIVVGSNVSYAAQLVAMEKVEKAFELLLSQPIKRSRIVLAKIVGASVASLIFAIAYVLGLFFMTLGLISPVSGQPVTGNEIGVLSLAKELERAFGVDVLSLTVISIGLALLLGLYSSGALGIVLGALSPDERTAAVLTTPIMLVYFGVAFLYLFLGLEPGVELAVATGITVLPIPALYVQSAIIGKPVYGLLSVGVAVLFSALLTLLATYIFNRDTVILGVRLRLRRLARSGYFSYEKK